MMRAARFAAKLGFQIERARWPGCHKTALLEKIAVERIQVEFEKLLLGKAVQNGLAAMLDTKLYLHCPGLKEGGQGLQYLAQQPPTLNNATQAWGALAICLALIKPAAPLQRVEAIEWFDYRRFSGRSTGGKTDD